MTHASLFSGIGGAEIAATWMGWRNLFHCEINPFGRKVLEYWYPNSTSYEDITKTDFSEWRGRVDVLTAGFPCQPFSVAGQRKGADDDRYLWPQVVRAVHEIRPAWVVGENVAGILTMVQPGEEVEVGSGSALFGENHLYRTEQQYVLETVCQDLEREGYSVQPFVIPRPTEGIGCGLSQGGLLPAPRATEIVEDPERFVKRLGDRTMNCVPNLSSMSVYRPWLLPTPMSTDIHHADRVKELKEAGGDTFHSRKNGETRHNGLTDFLDFHGMLPTPAAQDGKNCTLPPSQSDRDTLPGWVVKNCQPTDGQASQLNPLFVTEMMGFPSDWLVSPFQNGGQNPSKP